MTLAGSAAGMAPLPLAVLCLATIAGLLLTHEVRAIRSGRRPVPDLVPAGPRNWPRVGVKLIGLAITLLALISIYAMSTPVIGEIVGPFLSLVPVWLIGTVVLAPIIFAETDRRQGAPEDAYYVLGRLALQRRWQRGDAGLLRSHLLAWTVKGFFLPLMITWVLRLHGTLGGLFARGFDGPADVIFAAFILLFIIDLAGACIGYAMTFRLLGSHIRSTNPMLTGWIAALICYPPFQELIRPIRSAVDEFGWIERLEAMPALLIGFGVVVLSLELIYTLATVSHGLRFSNLTHRGIVTGGVYRFTKHPAYLAKNAFWWVMTVPFLLQTQEPLWIVCCLLAVNTLYFVRAKTEERHLSADPAYKAYCTYLDVHGLFAPMGRLARRLRPAGAAASGAGQAETFV